MTARDIEEQMSECPVDFKMTTAADAKAAVEKFVKKNGG